MAIATINPATGQTVQTFSAHGPAEVNAKLDLAQETFQSFRHLSFAQRGQWLRQAADILEQRQEQWAALMTLEMGKPIQQAIAEVKKCALVCRFYADQAEEFLADEMVPTDASQSFIAYQPLGVILAVMPWNFPFWQVFRFAAPALMAGNVALLKHASNVPQCALAIAEIFQTAGFPEGAFQTLLIGGKAASELMADDRIQAGTLTGSEPAGASFASAAAGQIKKTVLELGGSDPFIVLEDANLEEAIKTAVPARMQNNGQSCIAAKRFIVQASIAQEFFQRLTEKFQALQVGDPNLTTTDIGPLATPDILADIVEQVDQTITAGARCWCGGKPLDQPGNFYPPTLLTNIPLHAPTYRQEFFGPVALGFTVNNLEEAIALANDIPFGLGASAWTSNPENQQKLIRGIEAGAVFINGMTKSDPRIPFGGIKRSGFGRELGRMGILEFVNAKTVWIA
ncbi:MULTISPECIES: NAD-dependent succinate-semialdehyde dehydrogenase [unclassified Synechocystis]|uniref:NAD-dependent succinate-semialdehyde dehydrogenase n=1 Tax=unclassified Synechocystis TaxID=2640012 RepID=UPI000412F0E9|nr:MULTISPECIES: NAD-dependent succinate-semialdehyde dehydrogenase [unclassified Synechocystis]AIE72961.1 Succinate-semialdehyde dehydrogenase [NAD]; Succinate-semialdehyde dehydrogenase [NADP+] [Synechocystis sp. PCC 6714]MCT0252303.1 NAD-dependent succinate-semialdehyde dehydrogenase [Synechocystis sp. CS-94]